MTRWALIRHLVRGHCWHIRGGVIYPASPGLSYQSYRCCGCGQQERRRGVRNASGGVSITLPAKRLLP